MYINFFCCFDATAQLGPRTPHCLGFDITHRHITLGWTPLDEGLLPVNTRQKYMSPSGFKPTNQASARPQTCGLDVAVTGVGVYNRYLLR